MFTSGIVSYTLNGENVSVMLEYMITCHEIIFPAVCIKINYIFSGAKINPVLKHFLNMQFRGPLPTDLFFTFFNI